MAAIRIALMVAGGCDNHNDVVYKPRMEKGPAATAQAGVSARAQWRRARSAARRRRLLRVALVGAAVGLVALGIAHGDRRFALVAALAVLAAGAVRPDPDPDRWERGADGEAATAALLAQLSRRWVVLNDRAVPGSAANIDHLVIGPTGVWAIDTKATRARLRVRRGAVWAGEHAIDTGPATWEAAVVSERLAVAAVPLVVVHGLGLRRRGKRSGGVRIVPAGRVVRRLRRGRRMLNRTEVAALADQATGIFPPR
jgi:hypothetical protein